jgi:hypothetical protein
MSSHLHLGSLFNALFTEPGDWAAADGSSFDTGDRHVNDAVVVAFF